jgi:enoyl-CoA hydratase
MTEQDNDIITCVDRSTARIIINRPKALNALSKDMCAAMSTVLIDWAADDAIDRVLITAEGRAFCAGGDVRSIIPLIKQDHRYSDAYFSVEYTLHGILESYPKPVVTIADGLTMGGGAGVLLNASHPVITENMDFSMPEAAIGLFPDVAASLFLRHAQGYSGLLMGMTGWRIGAGDMIGLGLVQHAVAAADVASLCKAIIDLDSPAGLDDLIARHGAEMADTPITDSLDWINSRFDKATPVLIRDGLNGDHHPMADKIRHALDSKSPLSITVIHELLTNDDLKPQSVLDAIALDYVLACRISRYPDFSEGVRAVLIDKDNAPQWMHSDLAAVEDETIRAIFAQDNRPQFALPDDYIPLMKINQD